jgi:excisionase family DNA binding protein
VSPRTAVIAPASNPGPAREATPRLLSAQSAAKYLGVPYTSLRDWALRGHIPIVRVPDCRRLWFDRKDLDRAVESWKERSEP